MCLATSTLVVIQGAVGCIGVLQLYARLSGCRIMQNLWIFQHFLDDFHENLSNTQSGFGRGFQKEHALGPSPCVRLLGGDLTIKKDGEICIYVDNFRQISNFVPYLSIQIALVSHQDLVDVNIGVLLDL